MTLPEDIVRECEHSIAKLRAREARALARIRRALRSLSDCRRKLASELRIHNLALAKIMKDGKP